MLQGIRRGILVLSTLAMALALPALDPTPAHAADVPATADIKVPRVVVDWIKKNAAALYIIFDEIMDDLTGCPCPPPQVPPPPPMY
jgi:hypothetical protein